MSIKTIAGVLAITGLATAAAAATLKAWTNGTTQAANEIIGSRAGFAFHMEQEPGALDPCIDVGVWPVSSIDEEINVALTPPPDLLRDPPDPVAQVRLNDPSRLSTPSVTIQIFHPESVMVLNASGETLTCAPAVR